MGFQAEHSSAGAGLWVSERLQPRFQSFINIISIYKSVGSCGIKTFVGALAAPWQRA